MARRKRSKFPLIPGPVADLAQFLIGPGRTASLAMLILVGFAGIWYWGWQRVREDVLASSDYALSPDDIVVVNQAEWIRVDIRERVFHDAGIDRRLSLMDPNLNERIAAAFANNPWVAKVRRVSKRHPAGLTVELEYRRPVCMVEVLDGAGLIPVDVEGNVLPRDDFTLNEALLFPLLVDIDTTPMGTVGTQWGDPRVVGAAEIAAALGHRWQTFRLNRIVPVPTEDGRRLVGDTFELHTQGGSWIIWGHAPGFEPPGEPTAEEKIAYLDTCMERDGTLEAPRGRRQVIDLPALLRGGRTAMLEEETTQR